MCWNSNVVLITINDIISSIDNHYLYDLVINWHSGMLKISQIVNEVNSYTLLTYCHKWCGYLFKNFLNKPIYMYHEPQQQI